MNGWNGCDLQLCYLVQFIFTGVGQYIQPIIATNYGGGNCGVIHQCHVLKFSQTSEYSERIQKMK